MASFVYNVAKKAIADGEIDLADDDLRLAAVSTNTTADTENDTIDFMDDFTTLDEFDGANYARKVLQNTTTTRDNGNDRTELDADDVTWTSLGAGTRSIEGFILYKHVTNDSDSIPIAFIDKNGTPDGNDFVITWNAEGILQLA